MTANARARRPALLIDVGGVLVRDYLHTGTRGTRTRIEKFVEG
jgi:hypothetical protein